MSRIQRPRNYRSPIEVCCDCVQKTSVRIREFKHWQEVRKELLISLVLLLSLLAAYCLAA